MEIRPYSVKDEAQLFDMMREEGTEWECYYDDAVIEKYKLALSTSIVCVACEEMSCVVICDAGMTMGSGFMFMTCWSERLIAEAI